MLFSPHYLGFPFDLWPQFRLGVWVYSLINEKGSKSQNLFTILIVSLFIAAIMSAYLQSRTSPFLSAQNGGFIMALLFAIGLKIIYPHDAFLKETLPAQILRKIGENSYSLYLIHTIILSIFNVIVIKLHIAGWLGWLVFLIYLAFCIFCSNLFENFIRRLSLTLQNMSCS